MDERKDFLTRLKTLFGACGRKFFLQRLRDWFDGSTAPFALPPAPDPAPRQSTIIAIKSLEDWQRYVARLQDTEPLCQFLARSQSVLKKTTMVPFAKVAQKALVNIPKSVTKKFKTPEIDETLSEETAWKTGQFVKDCFWDLLRSCHSGLKHSKNDEKRFYESFDAQIEQYLSAIGVYRQNIEPGMEIGANAKWFDTPYIVETDDTDRLGTISEIEVVPHFIPYLDGDDKPDEVILKGTCMVFGEVKKK